VLVESINKGDTGNNWSKWNFFNIFQTVPEEHTDAARNQGTTENSHKWHCKHTADSNNVRYQLTLEVTLLCTMD
jgi:hypothetical protein